MWIKNHSTHNLTTARKAAEEEGEKQHAAQGTGRARSDLWLASEPELHLAVVQRFASNEQPHTPLPRSSATATHANTPALPRNQPARSVSNVAMTAEHELNTEAPLPTVPAPAPRSGSAPRPAPAQSSCEAGGHQDWLAVKLKEKKWNK